MKNKIKIWIGLVLLLMLIFTACGNKDKANTINEINNNNLNATDSIADAIVPTELEDEKNEAKLTLEADPVDVSDEVGQVFRKGTWFLSQGEAGIAYMSFFEDGKTGIGYNLIQGDEQNYAYNLVENILTISFDDYEDSIISENVEQLDEDTIVINVWNDEPYVLTYVSEKTSEEFEFFSAIELYDLAIDYYEKTEEGEVSGSALTIKGNADMTVTVELRAKNSDEIVASYVVSSLNAGGINELTGEKVELKE